MRRRNILLGTLALAVMCPGPAYSTTGQGRPYRSGQGFPAIHPRNDCTPSFTQQDVRDYVAHGVSLGPSIQADGEPAVTRVVFLTARDLARATADRDHSFSSSMEANYPPDMLVCYVGLSGTFSFVGDPYGGRSSLSATSIVFDAHTGNELVFIAGPLLG